MPSRSRRSRSRRSRSRRSRSRRSSRSSQKGGARITGYAKFVKDFARRYKGQGNMMRAAGVKWRKMTPGQKKKYGVKPKKSKSKSKRKPKSRQNSRRRTSPRTRTVYRYRDPEIWYIGDRGSGSNSNNVYSSSTPSNATSSSSNGRRADICASKGRYSCEGSSALGCDWTGSSCVHRG